MDKRQKEELVSLAKGGIRFDCPMAGYTTWRLGGLVEALYEAQSVEELRGVISYLTEENIPYLVVGRGSNLLVKDAGLDGVAIILCGSLAAIEQKIDDYLTIFAGAGLSIADLLNYCRVSGLGGLEFLAGIPGSVGGAVAMNAGAFGWAIEDRVQEIQLITPRGDVIGEDRAKLAFSYRELEIEGGSVIIRVGFRVDMDSEKIVTGRITEYLKRRKERQPLEFPSAGSVFKNPPNEYAGKLIEQAGLKGKRIGGAMISEKHANFIVNTGGAEAKDVLALLYLAKEKVREKTGIELETEIRIVGK